MLAGVKRVLGYAYARSTQKSLVSLRFTPLSAPLLAAGKAQIKKLK